MLIELPENKRKNILTLIQKFKENKIYTIREVASFIGTLGACCQASKYGWLYLKELEKEKLRL